MDAKDRGDFKAELQVRDIRCAACGGRRLNHSQQTGECYILRRTEKRVGQLESLR